VTTPTVREWSGGTIAERDRGEAVDYQFASYEPRFRPQIVELFARVFGGTRARSDAYLSWKYERNPYLPEPLFTLALDAGRVVAMRGFYGARWTANDASTSILAPVAADTAVAPEHRGRWLFDQMMRRATDDLRARGYDYAFNFSANEAVRLLSRRAGWHQLAPYALWTRPSPLRGRAGVLPRAGRRLRRRLGRTSAELHALDRLPASTGVIVSTEARPQAMADLVSATRDGQLGQLRDAAFYRWRFEDPSRRVRFLFVENGSELDGFFVFHQHHGRGALHLVDWAWRDRDTRRLLLRAAVAPRIPDLAIWSVTLPEGLLSDLRTVGFVHAPSAEPRARTQAGMLITQLAGAISDEWTLDGVPLLDADRWALRMADSDAY